MSAKKSNKINKFYFILGGALSVLAFIVAVTLRTVLSSVNTASQIEETSTAEVYVDKGKLLKVHEQLRNKDAVPLDLAR